MKSKPKVPVSPIQFIKDCVLRGHVFWTYHVNMRLAERHIPREAVLDAVDTYELVECYPETRYLPCYLVLARRSEVMFHVVFATDIEEDNVRVVTAYRPDPQEWEADLKTRRKQR